jgi:pimeloyl-ACP methyl ester carboxylesterase
MPSVHANGVDIYTNRYRTGPDGERPIIVIVHGLGVADHSGLGFLLGMPLATSADVIMHDLRGHGRSDFVTSGYQVTDHVADLVGVLDALAIDVPVHLVVYSYSGAIGVVTAMRHPERVASLFLLEGHLPLPGWGTVIAETLDAAAASADREDAVDEVKERFRMSSRRRASAFVNRGRRLILETTLRADVRNEPGFGRDDFARIECPVAGAYGDRSEIESLGDVLRDLVPGSVVHTIPGATHNGILEHAVEVRALIRGFVGLPEPDRDGSPRERGPHNGAGRSTAPLGAQVR